ncbi:MAG: vWA domain-containing protein [Anaerolineae bacterium]
MTTTARSHRHYLPVARALGWAGIAMLLAAIGLAGTAQAQTPAPEPGPDPSGCVLIDKAWVGRQFAPNFLVGDTFDVTATVKALCPAQSRPVHIVLVLDGSSTMAGEPNAALRKAAREFIDRLDLKDRPATQIGVVAFNGEATVLCQLTNRASQASLCVGRVGASGGGSNIAAGIYGGEDVLRRGRLRFEDPTVIREVMIVVTDGANSDGCPPVLAAADAVKAEGILLMTVCVTDACDADCISRAATAPNYHYVAGDIAQLNAVVASISLGLNVLLRTLAVDHVIAPGFEIVPGSIAPTPAVAEAGRIGWSRTDVTPDGVTVTYRLRAVSPGRYLPIWRSNTIDFTDLLGAAGRTETRTPIVDVFDPASPAPPDPDDLLLAERSLAIAPATAEIGDRLAAQLRLATPTTATVPAYVNIVLRVPPHLRIERATERFAIPGDSDGRRVSWWVDTADAWPIAFTATLRAVAAGEGGAAAIGYGPDGEQFKDVIFTAMSGPVRVTAPPGLPRLRRRHPAAARASTSRWPCRKRAPCRPDRRRDRRRHVDQHGRAAAGRRDEAGCRRARRRGDDRPDGRSRRSLRAGHVRPHRGRPRRLHDRAGRRRARAARGAVGGRDGHRHGPAGRGRAAGRADPAARGARGGRADHGRPLVPLDARGGRRGGGRGQGGGRDGVRRRARQRGRSADAGRGGELARPRALRGLGGRGAGGVRGRGGAAAVRADGVLGRADAVGSPSANAARPL